MNVNIKLLLAAALGIIAYAQENAQCDRVTMSHGVVCRCNATFCDTIQPHPEITPERVIVYTTSQAGKRLEMEVIEVPDSVSAPNDAIEIELNSIEYQRVIGFGGAFTDAAAYTLNALPTDAQDKLISSYFSRKGGARYSMGRVPLGAADFSRKSYSLVQTMGDLSLSDFAIQDDNSVPGTDYKLSLILRAQKEIENTTSDQDPESIKELRIFASIWSAPVWMKTCKAPPAPTGTNSCGNGFIPWILGRPKQPTYLFGGLSENSNIRNAYAQYFVKFFKAYNDSGVSLWGLTAQNEPGGNPTGNKWDNTNYSPKDLAHFVNHHLGPAMKDAFPQVKIMVGDDQYPSIPEHTNEAMESEYIDGVGYHWYNSMAGSLIGTDILAGDLIGGQIEVSRAVNTHAMNNRNGSKFLLMTEACTGYLDNVVQPGSWERGYNYMTNILHELESGAAGWVDWNLALNMSGGPNHAGNTVDAPIIIDSSSAEFYKQPMYYAIAHFSAFVPPGAIRLGISGTVLGFIGPSHALEVIAFRKAEDSEECVLIIANDHLTASLPVRGLSDFHTVIFQLPNGKRMIIEMGEHEFKTVLFHCPLLELSSEKVIPEEDDSIPIVLGVASSFIVVTVSAVGVFVLLKRRAMKKLAKEGELSRSHAPSL